MIKVKDLNYLKWFDFIYYCKLMNYVCFICIFKV